MASACTVHRRLWCLLRRLRDDRRGVAATEFAVIVPVMIVMFFATLEVSSGVAVDRKVTLVTRTLSDLVSQATTVTDTDLKNVFAASYGILQPYPTGSVEATISEIYVNKSNVAKIQWSKKGTVTQSGSTATATLSASSYNQGDTITLPTALVTADTYLIMSEVTYTYHAITFSKYNLTLHDKTYTRPRQSVCVMYGTTVCTTN
ncbi:TadE/TadG family type IV pilus assembly protein [Rhodopseudomonas sp. B29]|uniref:TadE/TadG family type IV pilus assembly protein n=1 Tax=Rhodopseudomonas sp. B29 TaxID=95607 RepID=UPI000347147C|nr:TadE/TadG family type IV pilus assembly protein [Rhodopseudomonas sp. B29]